MSVRDNLLRIKSEVPQGVELVAVSKFHPAEVIREAYDAGQRMVVFNCLGSEEYGYGEDNKERGEGSA